MINVVILCKEEEVLKNSLEALFENSPDLFSTIPDMVFANIFVGNFKFSQDFVKSFSELGVKFVDIREPYNVAYALNKLISKTNPESDILLLGSHVVCESPDFIAGSDFVSKLEDALADKKLSDYGIISPAMVDPPHYILNSLEDYPMHLFAITIRRRIWNAIGGFSLHYSTGFYLFMDFFRRVVEAGSKFGIFGSVKLKDSGHAQVMDTEKYEADKKSFDTKWGEGHYLGEYKPQPQDWNLELIKESQASGTRLQTHKVANEPGEEPDYTDSKMRYTIGAQHKAPQIISKFCKNTDFEMDGELLWSLIMLLKPKRFILSGAMQPAVIKIASNAANYNHIGCKVVGVDPNPRALKFLTAFRCEHICMNSIAYAEGLAGKDLITARADMIVLDEDPHTFELTTEWLDAWLPKMLNPGGFVIFHDIIQNRPEIQVKEAVREWVKDKPNWKWTEFEAINAFYTWPQGGLGLLSAPTEEED